MTLKSQTDAPDTLAILLSALEESGDNVVTPSHPIIEARLKNSEMLTVFESQLPHQCSAEKADKNLIDVGTATSIKQHPMQSKSQKARSLKARGICTLTT